MPGVTPPNAILFHCADAVNHSCPIIRDQQRSIRRNRYAHPPSINVRLARIRHQPTHERNEASRWPATFERHKRDFVAPTAAPAPRSVLTGERTAPGTLRTFISDIKRTLQTRYI